MDRLTQIDIEFETMVAKLTKPGAEILETLTADKCMLLHSALGILTEAAEIADAIKAHVIYGKPLDLDNIIEELGDLDHFTMQLSQNQLIDVGQIEWRKRNMAKLAKRYPNFEYTDQRGRERADKQEPPTDFRIAEESVGLHLENGVYTHPDCPFMYCAAENPPRDCGNGCMYRLQA